jgi:acyl-CoA reductase-like NAD-dependent aldehyde dehydrogenase
MLVVENPFDRSFIASVPVDDQAAIDAKLAAAHAFFREHPRGLDMQARIAVLESLQHRMRADFELLCTTALREGGKPLRDTRVEVERAIAGIGTAIAVARDEGPPTLSHVITAAQRRIEVRVERRPVGPVAALGAFNHPLNLLVHQAITAFASGCPVIVKPSEKVPLTALLLARLVHECGCPPAAWQTVVTADVSLAAALACDPRIRFLSFIGRASVGWGLRAKLPPGTRCALEHGGVAPAVLLDDADVAFAAERIAYGAFYHAGQVCISTQVLLVPRLQLSATLDALTARVATLRTGDPGSLDTNVGPLIRPTEVREAVEGGARVVVGGHRLSATCYAPTIVVDAPATCRLRTEEVFGPVLVVVPYEHEDEAIAKAQHPWFEFQSAVFGRDEARCMAFADALPGSTVLINEHTAFRSDDLRFAGLGHSGLGVGGIPFTMRELWVERQTIRPAPL